MFERLESGLFVLWHWIRGPMAGGAVLGRRLIEENGLSPYHSRLLMALGAAHILMGAAQRKRCSFLVVEERGLPLHAVVALGAARNVSHSELLAVNVFVTVLALCRCGLEVHVDQLGLKIWRPMTVDAGSCAVRSQQRELRLGVVEARKFLPRLSGVTGFASRHGTIGTRLQHAFFELTFMRIGMATGAIEGTPAVHRCLRLELG